MMHSQCRVSSLWKGMQGIALPWVGKEGVILTVGSILAEPGAQFNKPCAGTYNTTGEV